MREHVFEREEKYLSKYAVKSNASKGRLKDEEPCPMRTDFQRDRDRIMYCKSFIRLKNKTQVFFSPEGDHYMTRLTHTLDVAQVARSIARNLDLNEDLAEAIALGHDLGHTPFGHAGERTLSKLCKNREFKHNEQSLRVVDVLENEGRGLNLTMEVRDGILNHKRTGNPMTLEGKAVSLADRIAYLNHDVEDAIRAGVISLDGIPKNVVKVLGGSTKDRINAMITSIYKCSYGKNCVKLEEEVESAAVELRNYMFDKVYLTSQAMREEERAFNMLSALYEYFYKYPEKLPDFYRGLLDSWDREQVICDYISSMTDRYAVSTFKSIFVPENF